MCPPTVWLAPFPGWVGGAASSSRRWVVVVPPVEVVVVPPVEVVVVPPVEELVVVTRSPAGSRRGRARAERALGEGARLGVPVGWVELLEGRSGEEDGNASSSPPPPEA